MFLHFRWRRNEDTESIICKCKSPIFAKVKLRLYGSGGSFICASPFISISWRNNKELRLLLNKESHPSLDGHSRKIMTRELVYYILLGTLRSAQKCLWSNLRASFFGDIHPWRSHFSRGLCRPQNELQMVAMDSWRNSDVF